MSHKPYTLKTDYRHFVAGDVVMLRDEVAQVLTERGVLGKSGERRAESGRPEVKEPTPAEDPPAAEETLVDPKPKTKRKPSTRKAK